jgi:hypothetical protein
LNYLNECCKAKKNFSVKRLIIIITMFIFTVTFWNKIKSVFKNWLFETNSHSNLALFTKTFDSVSSLEKKNSFVCLLFLIFFLSSFCFFHCLGFLEFQLFLIFLSSVVKFFCNSYCFFSFFSVSFSVVSFGRLLSFFPSPRHYLLISNNAFLATAILQNFGKKELKLNPA